MSFFLPFRQWETSQSEKQMRRETHLGVYTLAFLIMFYCHIISIQYNFSFRQVKDHARTDPRPFWNKSPLELCHPVKNSASRAVLSGGFNVVADASLKQKLNANSVFLCMCVLNHFTLSKSWDTVHPDGLAKAAGQLRASKVWLGVPHLHNTAVLEPKK